MASNHVQPGKVLDYVNTTGAVIASGSVVVAGALLGVALVNIPANGGGSVALEGVFEVPKKVGTAISQGVALVYKTADGVFATGATAAGDVSGASVVAFASAAADAASMLVKFTGVPGTVAA